MQFKELNIIPEILNALEKENYAVPTPIQEKAIPLILSGKDLLGCAQTGTGKTAAFAIPTLQLLSEEKVPYTAKRNIRALIVTPTRELALQIYESFCTYGEYTKLKYCVIFGGVSQKPQEKILRKGVDILVATPGRLNDLIKQKLIDLNYIKIFILDEADRMLDMGFINDVNKIIAKTPTDKQTLFFSATMPSDVAKLSNSMLKNPAKIKITPESSTVDTIEQYLYYVDKHNKKDLLLHILKDETIVSALVFTRTKHGADRLVEQLAKENVIAQAIHADKSQGARQSALSNFKNKTLRVLIATDIAARGIDIDELSHVINFDMPNVSETYVHRIGRTGRAGLGGVAISFCDFEEKELLAEIEKLIRKHLKEIKDHPYPLMNNFPALKTTQPRKDVSRKTTSPPTTQKKTSVKSTSSPKRTSVKSTSSPKKTSANSTSSPKKTLVNSTTSPNKKYRMTADGTLKEKPSYTKFSSKGKKDTAYSKKKNYKGQ
jgi:ATP-dependent RNA helicase RhlE